MCDCISVNCPEQGGMISALSVVVPPGLCDAGKIVCIDSCIAPAIAGLWSAKISTHSNCCGHNGLFPRHVVVNHQDAGKARKVLDFLGYGDVCVSYWSAAQRFDDLPFVQKQNPRPTE